MTETIQRDCAVCGITIEIIVHDDGSYDGGHYSGPLLPTDCEKESEYWECDDCYEVETDDDGLHHVNGRAECPHDGCDWWVPEGMEYLWEGHRREEH